METPTTLPNATEMATREFTLAEWLTYYRNTWIRHALARTVDVISDEQTKQKDPETMVMHFNELGQPMEMPVKARLEARKILLQDALDIVRVVEKLTASGDNFESTYWSPEALAVAADMMPEPESEKQEQEVEQEKVDPSTPVEAEVETQS